MITLQRYTTETDFLRPREKRYYPPDNNPPFEEWFFDHYDQSRNKSDRIFLPILPTELNKHCLNDRRIRRAVDVYFKNLDKSKKYAILVQHDDGILFNMDGIDVKVFGMGCKGDVQLPLVCQPHKYEFKETERPIFASFIGSLTHPIRKRMVAELKGKEGYFISTEPTSLETYCKIMSMSKFVLCPRGYGKTSYRIQEALQYGAIPVYISDDGYLFSEGCVTINVDDLLCNWYDWGNDEPINSKKDFAKMYTYEAVSNMIYENLHSL